MIQTARWGNCLGAIVVILICFGGLCKVRMLG
jgi:hypothetical protein